MWCQPAYLMISRQSSKCDLYLCDMCPTSWPVELSFAYVLWRSQGLLDEGSRGA